MPPLDPILVVPFVFPCRLPQVILIPVGLDGVPLLRLEGRVGKPGQATDYHLRLEIEHTAFPNY